MLGCTDHFSRRSGTCATFIFTIDNLPGSDDLLPLTHGMETVLYSLMFYAIF